jgi:hypothetical protein
MKIRKHEVPIVRKGNSKSIAWSIELGVTKLNHELDVESFGRYKVLSNGDDCLLFKGKPSRRMLERFAYRSNLPKGTQFSIVIYKYKNKQWETLPNYIITVH